MVNTANHHITDGYHKQLTLPTHNLMNACSFAFYIQEKLFQ